jgi:hypothetical protein
VGVALAFALCVSAVSLASHAQSSSPGAPPSLAIEIDACAAIPRSDVAPLVASELGADIADSPSAMTTSLTVHCSASMLVLHVDDPITGKSLDRSIDPGDVPDDARARWLAHALVDLVAASWAELLTQTIPAASASPLAQAQEAAIEALRARTGGGSSRALLPAIAIEPLQRVVSRPSHAQMFPTVDGWIGLLHTATTDAAPRVGFRAGLFLGYANATITDPTTGVGVVLHASRVTGVLTAGLSLLRYLDLHAAVRVAHSETDIDPARSITTVGDGAFGLTGILPLGRAFAIGLDASVLTQSGNHGVASEATGANFRLQSTFDFERMRRAVPMRLHLNMGYVVDNSAAGVAALELQRQMMSPGWSPAACDPTMVSGFWDPDLACWQQVTAFERFAWNVNRADRVYTSIALELWYPRLDWLHGFVEMAWHVPIVRSGFVCFNAMVNASDHDHCLKTTDSVAADPAIVSLGLRAATRALAGFGATIGVDIAVPSTTETVRELAPVAPWTAWVGIAYARPVGR